MEQKRELRKPRFIKVRDIEKTRSGYNVLVKVVSADIRDVETKTGEKIRMVDAVVGDETGIAKAFFKGANAAPIQKGKVVAIRNGLKRFIKNFISLELDIFGRVTEEKETINVDESYNISEHEHKLEGRPRRNRNDRQPRRDNRRGGPKNYNRPHRDERRPQRQQNDRRPRRDFEDRRPRRDFEDRRPRREDDDRRPKRNFDRDFDRRRQDTRGPRRDNIRQQPRREQYRENRAPINWIKIDEISPGDENLNIIAKVLQEQLVQGKRTMIRCTLGDETGIVKAFLPESSALRIGKSIALFDVEARVIREHIEIVTGRRGRVNESRRQVGKVNEEFDLSAKAWIPAE